MNIRLLSKYVFRSVALIAAFTIVLLSFASCSGEAKTVYELLAENEPGKCFGMIINNPKEEVISKVVIDKSLTLDDEGERFLIIPKYKNSVLEIWTLVKDGETYKAGERVYLNEAVEENFVIDVIAERSDEPRYEVVIRTPKWFSRYPLVSPAGSKDEQSFEYLTADNADYGKKNEFSFDEIAFLFYRGQDYLTSSYGRPTDTRIIERNGTGTATRLLYGKSIFDINNSTSLIYRAIMLDDELPHVRGIKIGESLPMVLVSFPNENDGYTDVFKPESGEEKIREGASYTYQLLYGKMGGDRYGYIKYDAREVVTDVIYVDNGNSVIFSFKNNRVLSIEYRTDN